MFLTAEEKQYIIDNADRQTATEIAEWIGCCKQTVGYYKKKYCKGLSRAYRWKPCVLNELAELRRKGYTNTELAKRFDCSAAVIDVQLWYMRKQGVSLPKAHDLYLMRRNNRI